MFSANAFDLLAELHANNNKDWFNTHRDEVRGNIQHPFAALLERVTERLSETDVPLVGSERTMFRMNRDVRFSHDKSPYQTHVSGMLTQDGSKAEADGIGYVHLDRSGGFVAVGWYKLTPKELGPIRDHIVENAADFQDVVDALGKAKFELSQEQLLTAMPRGYSEHADSPIAPYLKLQTLMVQRALPKSAWSSDDVVDRIVATIVGAAPLLKFGRERSVTR